MQNEATATVYQSHKKLFYGGGGGEARVKMLAAMIDQRRKIKKNIGWNALKQSSIKLNLDQNINDFKSHICNSLFRKYYFGRTTLVHTFQWTSSQLFLFQNL